MRRPADPAGGRRRGSQIHSPADARSVVGADPRRRRAKARVRRAADAAGGGRIFRQARRKIRNRGRSGHDQFSGMTNAPRAPLPGRWFVISIFFLSSSINYLDRQSLATLAPLYRAEFHLTNADYGWIVAAFSLAYAAAAP